MQQHFLLPHGCPSCPMRFLYPFQRDSHITKHTGTGLIPCEWRGCKRKFTSKRSMSQHLEKHRNEQSGKKWTCEQCLDKPTYKTKSNFDQHTRGLSMALVSSPGVEKKITSGHNNEKIIKKTVTNARKFLKIV